MTCTPLSTLHEWEHRLEDILRDMLDALERDKDFGYFDAVIDAGTHAVIIKMLIDKYVDDHARRYHRSKGEEYEPKFKVTKEEIDKQFKGGYTKAMKVRLEKLLVDGET